MIGLYLWGVSLTFVFTLIAMRNGSGSNGELGQDIASAAFMAVFWPFTLLVILISPARK